MIKNIRLLRVELIYAMGMAALSFAYLAIRNLSLLHVVDCILGLAVTETCILLIYKKFATKTQPAMRNKRGS